MNVLAPPDSYSFSRPLGLAVSLTCAVICACASVAEVPAEAPKADTVVPVPECPAAKRQATGECCGVGEFYSHEGATCHPAGPAECGDQPLFAPLECRPRWCASWRDLKARPCVTGAQGCQLQGHRCDARSGDDLGCEAGRWPEPKTGLCIRAGLRSQADAPLVEGAAAPAVRSPNGVPKVAPLPALNETRFCPNGEVSSPGDGAACLPAGVTWLCPPGFDLDKDEEVEAGELRGCVPDPAACGDDVFGGLQQAPGRLFVAQGAPTGGDGTRSKPFASIKQAVSAAPSGAMVVVGAGTYVEAVTLTAPIKLQGRCAAMVRIAPAAGFTAVHVTMKQGALSQLSDVTLVGDRGLVAVGDGTVRARSLRILQSSFQGAVAQGKKVRLMLEDAFISRCGIGIGAGVHLTGGARAELRRVRIHRNRAWGLVAFSAGTFVEAEQLLIDGTQMSSGILGRGVEFSAGAAGVLKAVRVSGSLGGGLLLLDSGSSLDLRSALVDNNGLDATAEALGYGVAALSGATATLNGVRLSANRTVGLLATGAQTALQCTGLLIDGGVPAPGAGSAHGLLVHGGSRVEVDSAHLVANRQIGLFVQGEGSELVARRLLVRGTLADAVDKTLGIGLDVNGGAYLDLIGGRLHHNRTSGLRASGSGTEVHLRDLVVDDTQVQASDGHLGIGVDVGVAATLSLEGGRLTGNHAVGLRVRGGATKVRVVGTLVDGTLPAGALQYHGSGAQVLQGAQLELVGSQLSDNRSVGLFVAQQGSHARVVGTTISDTHALPGASLGIGAGVAQAGARLELVASRVATSRAAGVAVWGADCVISGSVIADTQASQFMFMDANGRTSKAFKMADGVVAQGVLGLLVEDSLIAKQERAGLLISGGQAVSIKRSCATGGLFGVALQEAPDVVLEGNLLHDNGTNVASEAGILLPPAPQTSAP